MVYVVIGRVKFQETCYVLCSGLQNVTTELVVYTHRTQSWFCQTSLAKFADLLRSKNITWTIRGMAAYRLKQAKYSCLKVAGAGYMLLHWTDILTTMLAIQVHSKHSYHKDRESNGKRKWQGLNFQIKSDIQIHTRCWNNLLSSQFKFESQTVVSTDTLFNRYVRLCLRYELDT